MTETGGDVFAVTNEETAWALTLFEKAEGIDIEPAAAVAVASLKQAIEQKAVEKDAVIMLNITGGGIGRFKSEHELVYKKPDCVFSVDEDPEIIRETVMGLFV